MRDNGKFKIKREIEKEEETAKVVTHELPRQNEYLSIRLLMGKNSGVEKKQVDAEIEQAKKFDESQKQRIIDLDKKMFSQQRRNEQIAEGYMTEDKHLKEEQVNTLIIIR
jgi:hypothetical protein